MLREQIDRLLTYYKGHAIAVKSFDDIFGVFDVQYDETHAYEPLRDDTRIYDGTKSNHYRNGDIVSITLLASESEVVELIDKAKSMDEAWAYGKDKLTVLTEEALNVAQDRLHPPVDRQNAELLKLAQTAVKHAKVNVSPEEVIKHVCFNLLGTNEITHQLERRDFITLVDKIPSVIKKLQDIPF